MARVKVTPLLGVGEDAPSCTLLQLDDFTCLIDCGWNEKWDVSLLEPVKRIVHSLDAVLLTQPDVRHLGALPYLVASCGLACPVLSTMPVRRMGEQALYDNALALQAVGDFTAFTLEDVDAAFKLKSWVQLRYFQHYELTGRGAGITVTPYNSGHMVGGSVWKITTAQGDDLAVALEWCHKRERHLNPCALTELFTRPALLLADASVALRPGVEALRRDSDMLDVILATLRTDGSVLIPVDSAGRVLELALMLDDFWAREKMVYPLVLLSHMGEAVMELAKSQLEYMSESIGKAFETKRNNPFNFRSLKLCRSQEQLGHMQGGPKVVLATHSSLEYGPARELVLEWAEDARNTLIFVDRAPADTLAGEMQRHVQGEQPQQLRVRVSRREPLQGEELEEYERQQQEKERQEAAAALAAARQQLLQQQAAQLPGSPAAAGGPAAQAPLLSAAGTPAGATASAAAAAGQLQLVLRSNSTALSRLVRDGSTGLTVQQLGGAAGGGAAADVLLDGFAPPQDALHPMFPDEDEPLLEEWDDYGAKISHEDFKLQPLLPAAGTRAAAALAAGAAGAAAGAAGAAASAATRGVATGLAAAKAVAAAAGSGGGKAAAGSAAGGSKRMSLDGEAQERGPGAGAMQIDGGDGDGNGGESDDEAEAAPTKVVVEEQEVTVKAVVRYFDYEGRADGRTLKQALQDLAPRTVVVLRGSEEARREVSLHCERELACFTTTTLTPGGGESCEVVLPPSHTFLISDELHAQLRPHRLNQYCVTFVEAQVGPPEGHSALPQLLPASPEDVVGTEAEDGVFIASGASGIRMTDVKKALADAGIASVWQGASLACGPIIISKAGGGVGAGAAAGSRAHLVLEGALCAEFYRIRDVIYGQYNVGGGG